MKTKKTNPYNIKTPTTVEDFRENLMNYFVCLGDGNVDTTMLYVQEGEIKINEISSLSDVYEKREMGFDGDNESMTGLSSPHIIPRISLKKEVTEYMGVTGQRFSSNGYFYDEDNFEVHECNIDNYKEDHKEFHKNTMMTDKSKWWSLDNQWLREFYMITLGDYSGYVKVEDEEVDELVEG